MLGLPVLLQTIATPGISAGFISLFLSIGYPLPSG